MQGKSGGWEGSSGLWIAVSRGILLARCTPLLARVVKLVDTGDLKSPGHCGRAGSSPAPGTIYSTTVSSTSTDPQPDIGSVRP